MLDRLSLLTPAERRLVALLVQGLPIATIAATLHRSEKTIDNQKHAVFARLGVQARVEILPALLGPQAMESIARTITLGEAA